MGDFVENEETNVLTIVFHKSNSVNYESVLSLSRQFKHCIQKDKVTEINITADELPGKMNHIAVLFAYIGKWRHTKIIFNGTEMAKAQLSNLSQMLSCAARYRTKETHCYDLDGKEGWRCKFLDQMPRHFSNAYWEYIRRPYHWFSFGRFEDNYWTINKEAIKQRLREEAEEKVLIICPYFNFRDIENILSDFPERIDPETDKDWCLDIREVDTGYSLETKVAGIIPRKIAEDKRNYAPDGTPIFNFLTGPQRKSGQEDSKNKNRNVPKVSFSEIGGLGDTLKTIREVIELPMTKPELFKHLGIVPHKGILLYGPPGCGKTLIAKAIANEINAHFIDIKGPELSSKWVGQSEENLRNVFDEARRFAPAIIFFDEFDAIGHKRSGEETAIHDSKFVNQLLTLLDGFEDYSNVRVIASTNRPELLDEALVRPGRFDYHLEIKNPTQEGCREILNIYAKKMPLSKEFDLELFSKELTGLSGADISFIAREAAYSCMRRNIGSGIIQSDFQPDLQNLVVQEWDFFAALSKAKKHQP